VDTTVVIAALGFVSTLVAAGLVAHWQRVTSREARLFDARVRAYTECLTALFEYERATYDRVKARLTRPETEREVERQLAYRLNGSASASVAGLTLMTASDSLRQRADAARSAIGDMNQAHDNDDLRQKRTSIRSDLALLADEARAELEH